MKTFQRESRAFKNSLQRSLAKQSSLHAIKELFRKHDVIGDIDVKSGSIYDADENDESVQD